MAAPAQAIVGGQPTAAFLAVGTGVQVTPDWVLTAAHTAFGPGDTYTNGYGSRLVAARYWLPGGGEDGANDIALMRLQPGAAAAPYLPVSSDLYAEGPFAPLPVTLTSPNPGNGGPGRGYAPSTVSEFLVTADPDDEGPLGPVTVNWLVSRDLVVRVEGGDSGGGLFAGHVADSSVLLGLASALLTNGPVVTVIFGSAFVQPASYRTWIDATMAADLADGQLVQWVGSPVPEPAPWLLALLGAALLRRATRRRSSGR